MPALSRDLYESLCGLNKKYLSDQGFVSVDTNDIVLGDNSNQIITRLIENEKLNKQKENFKSKYIMQLMTIGLMLLATGFALAPFFIASIIVLPILPVLLCGFAILAITKFILSIKNNSIEAHVTHLANTLDQLKEVDMDVGQEIVSTFNDTIRDIKSKTEAVSEKIDKLEERGSEERAQILVKLGKFQPATSSIPVDGSAIERAPSPVHS